MIETIRTTKSTITFRAPFWMRAIEQLQPGGTYDVETDDDVIEGNDRTI